MPAPKRRRSGGPAPARGKARLMNRRSFLRAVGCGGALLGGCRAGVRASPADERPDVLFIAIDDMNDWTTLFDADNPIQTPNLKRLAARGTFFRRAYCVAPACNPSRTAILTGRHPSASGVYGNRDAWRELLPDVVTLPQHFARHGYATMGAGKIFHHGAAGRDRPGNPSFEAFFGMRPTRAPKPNYNGYREGPLSKTAFDWGVHDRKLIDCDTVEWVEKAMEETTRRPLFLAAGIFKPHLPFYADRRTFDRYPLDKTRVPPRKDGDLDDVPPIGRNMVAKEDFIYKNVIARPEDSPGSLKTMVQCYQASADFADQMVGRLLDKLDATGRADRTVIVLWSDHGYHLGDKETCVKFTLWEKATRVPFIIVAPGVTQPGSVCDHPVSLLDIYPTLADLCGLPERKALSGVSLVPLLKKPDAPWPRPALMTMGRGNHAVRSDRWRYIRYIDGTEELYDHESDPWEWTNLADDPGHARVKHELARWMPKQEVPWPINKSKHWIYRNVTWDDAPQGRAEGARPAR